MLRDQHCKFIASQSRAARPLGRLALDDIRDLLEDFVPDHVAIEIVDRLEAVQIQSEDGQRKLVFPRAVQLLIQELAQIAPVP